MKTSNDKSVIRIICFSLFVMLFQSCASLDKASSKHAKQKRFGFSEQSSFAFDHFDKKNYTNDYVIISKMISAVQPELLQTERDLIACQISNAIRIFKIEPQVMVAIIDTESDFNSNKISSTGDISVAQINLRVWNKEFIRMKKQPINEERIKRDQEFAILKMAEILSIIKNRYGKNDRRWYARYHSNTIKYKNDYLQKLEIRINLLANIQSNIVSIAQTN